MHHYTLIRFQILKLHDVHSTFQIFGGSVSEFQIFRFWFQTFSISDLWSFIVVRMSVFQSYIFQNCICQSFIFLDFDFRCSEFHIFMSFRFCSGFQIFCEDTAFAKFRNMKELNLDLRNSQKHIDKPEFRNMKA